MRRVLTLMACMGLLVSAGASAFEKPPFPRLAVNWIADQRYEDPSVQRQLALGSIAMIAIWPGWESGRGTTPEQVIKNIKAINPKTLVFFYVVNNEIPKDRTNSPFAELYSKLDSMGWYLYSNGSVVDSGWPGAAHLNNTAMSRADSNGDHWPEFFAKWTVSQYYLPSPSLDGMYLDNMFWKPRVNGDWNSDGQTDNQDDASVQSWFRSGMARHFEVLNQRMPGKYQMGNIADWGDPKAVLTELQGKVNGGFMEGMMGYPWSVDEWADWQYMMAWYRKSMAALAEPKLGMFAIQGARNDFQRFRYGFTTCLMDDGYFVFNYEDAHYGDAPTFDEYSANLGFATSSPPTSAWQNGVYRRDFANGIALVNPKGNGTRTVTLETDFKRISGSQAPNVNNGQTGRTVTLNERDGIILLKLNPDKQPVAPAAVTVR